jgi:hypothetical protein
VGIRDFASGHFAGGATLLWRMLVRKKTDDLANHTFVLSRLKRFVARFDMK